MSLISEQQIKETQRRLNQAIPSAQLLQADVNRLIEATPTSEKRNALCDANIHMMAVITALQSAQNRNI